MRRRSRGKTSIIVTAGLAVAILLVVSSWRLGEVVKIQNKSNSLSYVRASTEQVISARNPAIQYRDWQSELAGLGIISTSTDGVFGTQTLRIADTISEQFLSGYITLKESGRYTPETARDIGRSIGENVRAPSQFVMHGESEFQKDENVSLERVLAYRADMREALSVLISDAPPEFELFGKYIETKNPERLRELEVAATRYQDAEKALLKVVVPKDAVSLHVRAANALGSYADAINQLIRHADDSLSTLAVLRTYNDAEREMLYAFDALASYYVRKSTDVR